MAKFIKLIRNNEGATAIEYGLIAALIAVAAITAMTSIGTKLGGTFQQRFEQALSFFRSLRTAGGGTERYRRLSLCTFIAGCW